MWNGWRMEQAELVRMYNRLRTILKRYEGPFRHKFDLDSRYDLWSFKDVVVAGRPKKEVFFAGLIIQSSYVGFYYMPIYLDPGFKSSIAPGLLATLKGKTCFYIRKLDDKLERQIDDALKKGLRFYMQKGLV
jgi:hypothetical protein